MTTDADALYTLIHYRPNGRKYVGGGDYDSFDSEIGFEQGLSFEKLRFRIIEHARRARGSDSDNDNPMEFAILLNGKPVASIGEAMWTFADEDLPDPQLEELFHEANLLTEKEKREAAEVKRKAEEEKSRAYAARERDRRYFEAKELIKKYEAEQKKETT